MGLVCFCLGKMGFRSLGLGKKCQEWEWNKYFVTMTNRDITYFLRIEKRQKMFQAPCLCQF